MIIIDDPHFSHSYWYPDFALASPASRPPRWAKACRCPGGNTTPSARRNGPASEAPSWEPGAMRCCSHFVKFWHFLTSCVFWTVLYMFWLFSNVEVVSNWLRSWLTMSGCTCHDVPCSLYPTRIIPKTRSGVEHRMVLSGSTGFLHILQYNSII